MGIASAEGSAAGERLPRAAGAVVIGGGIVGVATADHLAEAGVGGVVLLEREHGLGLGSTGRCAGGFRHQFSSEVNVRLSLESVRMIRTFTATHGLPLDVHVDGYLFLSRDDATWEGYRAAAAMQRRLGARVELLDAAACTELVPGLAVDDVVGATFGPDDGIADPSGLVNGYATLARRAGVTIVTGVTVTALSTSADGGRVTGVETSAGAIASPLVCVAAGVWSRALCATAGVELPVEPHPRQLAQTTDFAGRPPQRTLVVDTSTMFFFHREGTGVLMGLPPTRDDATFSTAPDPAFLADELLPVAVRVLPAVEAAGLATTWVGLYEMTPDHHPLIGRIQAVDGLLVATGYSGHGFQHGPITGRLLAEIATTGAARTVDIHALRPERFAEGQPVVESFVV
jgi:glycine/D-amino acid oxidase-like deaminating enzyme